MDTLLPFTLFAFVASVTPGPNNVLVLACATRFGFMKAMPMVLGACSGAALVVLLVGTGLARPLADHPMAQQAITGIGLLWLTWLSWQLFRAVPAALEQDADARVRIGFWRMAALQIVNPKVWMLALAVIGVFAVPGAGQAWRVALLSLIFFVVALPSVVLWAWLGASAAKWIASPSRQRLFNRSMAVLLLVSTWYSLLP